MDLTRRSFLQSGSLVATAGITLGEARIRANTEPVKKSPASERIRVGCIGVGGRAANLCDSFSRHPNSEIVAVADIDSRRIPEALEKIAANQGYRPESTGDFRHLIDNPKIDAIVVGTPDFWHAIPTIMACQAGKDVYVEKPDGHNIVEGQRMVAAQKKHGRIVQLGTQSRTSPHFREAIEFIKTGKLGTCLFAKSWENTKQGSIGRPADTTPPEGVDYDFWVGPAKMRPYNPVRFHGNWRWWFDLGTGDLGNDGVHRLDIARWALSAAVEAQGHPPLTLPKTINATGGKWYFDDLQEWADTLSVTYEFAGTPGRILTYEMRLNAPYKYLDESEGAVVYGDQGYIILGNARWRAYGPKDQLMAQGTGSYDDIAHVTNFLECIKTREKTNADLETVGHPSSVLCHAGNISWRVGRKLTMDPATEEFINDGEANALRTREEYRAPWLLPEV